VIYYVQPSHAGHYRVRMQNALATNYAHAALVVQDKPALRITEAMADSRHVGEIGGS